MFEKIFQKISESKKITIFGHIFPDGDCYGSQIALRNSLRKAFPDKEIYAVGSGLSIFFDYISPMDQIDDDFISNSLAILLDGNDLDRMEDNRIFSCHSFVKIDHHVENKEFKRGPKIVDENASSTCELVYDFLIENKLPIDQTIANCLFLGMMTDTGKFSYIKPFSSTITKAGNLCELGANPQQITHIFGITTENDIAFKGYFMSHFVTDKNGIIYIILTKEELNRFNITAARAASSVNLIGNTISYPVWCAFAEDKDGVYRCEFRSPLINVQKVANKFGGGGHEHASGASIKSFNQETLNKILNEIANSIKEVNVCGKKN